MPFTMEGTTLEAAGGSNGFSVASLVLGIIGIPSACAMIPPVLAIVFGIVALSQIGKSGQQGGGKGMAIAGIILGVVQVLAGTYFGPAAQQVSGYLVILLVLALRPQGLLARNGR